ncbi:MAG: aromatic ring-hydroxylating dioxygenase subunit alpha [Ottowia sp.]|uniref:aromatic ring-hydroxylating dioxygenase subunit alpha n=1 Tax=Ottowia sp. TaxID=1898956 RepID=UPI003C72100F
MLNMFVENCWYVAAWSHEVGEKPFSRTILGEPICFFRGGAGEVVALLDRCPHRAAPLSMGRIENGQLRCMYHGVKFGADGRCVEIPGQDRIPPSMCARSYRVVERNRWIWIWMGAPESADASTIPDTWSLDSPEWAYKPGYYHYDAPHLLICDNLLDFSHIGYVHPTTLGGTENIAKSKPVVKPQADGVRVERWLLDEVPAPFHARVASFAGRVDRWHFYDFKVPGILIMHSGVQATGTGAPDGRYQDALEFRSCQAVTPETTGSSHYFYAVPRNFAIADEEITNKIFDDIVAAFEEDRVMIEAQARRLGEGKPVTMVAIGADAGLTQFRRLLSARLQAEKES